MRLGFGVVCVELAAIGMGQPAAKRSTPATRTTAPRSATPATPSTLRMPTPLTKLQSAKPCNRCDGTLLPGKAHPHPKAKWGIISDLPESFRGHGVLYSTRDILPPNGGAAEMLKQRKSHGFTAIDGSFDVFLFHLLKESTATARIVVYVKNNGGEPVTMRPRQVIKSEGVIGKVHEFESTLASRVLQEEWDQPVESLTLPAGQGGIVAYGKQFGAVPNGPDSSRNVNCFGYVRGTIEGGAKSDLEVSVIAIPAGDLAQMQVEAEMLLDEGAESTDEVGLKSEPEGCALKRAVGVYPNVVWKNEPMVVDVSALADRGTTFPMALPKIQTAGCEAAQQTVPLVLRPGYTREDTIGNYMMEYDVRFTLTNRGKAAARCNVVFGKQEADIGLAYQAIEIAADAGENPYEGVEVQAQWAGPKQSAREKALFKTGLSVKPGETKTVGLRFLICGNSSLPFYLGLKKQ